MTGDRKDHLREEDIIRALVDEGDLEEALRSHLSTCGPCRARKDRLETGLSLLGQRAAALVPSPRRPVRLPAPRVSTWKSNRAWGWRSPVAAAAALVLLVALIWWSPLFPPWPGQGERRVADTISDEQLMAEVRLLEERPLPQIYYLISHESEAETNEDEEFTDFIIPVFQMETTDDQLTGEV